MHEDILHEESRLLEINVRLLGERYLCKEQRRKYRTLQGKSASGTNTKRARRRRRCYKLVERLMALVVIWNCSVIDKIFMP